MPYGFSNMSSKIFYSSLGAEILRIGRTTHNVQSFKLSAKKITERMINQGATDKKIQHCLQKTFGCHFEVFRSYAPTCNNFVDKIMK